MRRLSVAVLLAMALAGCKKEVCVRQGLVDEPDYITVPQFTPGLNGTVQMTMTQQYVGSHKAQGCVEWKEVEEDRKQ